MLLRLCQTLPILTHAIHRSSIPHRMLRGRRYYGKDIEEVFPISLHPPEEFIASLSKAYSLHVRTSRLRRRASEKECVREYMY